MTVNQCALWAASFDIACNARGKVVPEDTRPACEQAALSEAGLTLSCVLPLSSSITWNVFHISVEASWVRCNLDLIFESPGAQHGRFVRTGNCFSVFYHCSSLCAHTNFLMNVCMNERKNQ